METANPMAVLLPAPRETSCPVRCPLCNGPMLELRGQWQCGQCFFTICEECGGVEAVMAGTE